MITKKKRRYTRKKSPIRKIKKTRVKKEWFIAHALKVWLSWLKKEAKARKEKKIYEEKVKKFRRSQAWSRLKTNIKTFLHR